MEIAGKSGKDASPKITPMNVGLYPSCLVF
jgi:hypothetical protein